VGYLAIGAAWLVHSRAEGMTRKYAALAAWGLAAVGTLFSVYLTFLEAFVIGATCFWCITSAVLMGLILWATTAPALGSLAWLQRSRHAGAH
jgi:uncharacterized membrane protein